MLNCIAYRSFLGNIPGGPIIKHIISPRRRGSTNYSNNRLVYYNVQCEADHTLRLIIDAFDLEGKKTISLFGQEKKICVDYVNITEPFYASQIYCGSYSGGATAPTIILHGGQALVTFRTSMQNTRRGFSITAICADNTQTQEQQKTCSEEQVRQVPVKLSIIPQKHVVIIMLISYRICQLGKQHLNCFECTKNMP